jgi:hypothetical protein
MKRPSNWDTTDTEKFLAAFPKDGVAIDSERRFKGHDWMRLWSDHEFIGAHGRMSEGRDAKEGCGHRESQLETQLLQRPVSLRDCVRR